MEIMENLMFIKNAPFFQPGKKGYKSEKTERGLDHPTFDVYCMTHQLFKYKFNISYESTSKTTQLTLAYLQLRLLIFFSLCLSPHFSPNRSLADDGPLESGCALGFSPHESFSCHTY